jgi:AcrR family transcriptional regulator
MLETNEQLIIEQLPGVRDNILSVAIEVFAAQGYRAASVFEIAQKSGLNQAAFKQYFSSKRDVFLALIEKYYAEFAELLEENLQRFIQSLGKSGEILTVWRSNTVRIFKYHARNPKLARIILHDARALDDDYSRRVEELSGLIKLQMQDALHLLERHGIIQVPDLDMAATLMMGSANAIIEEYVIDGKRRKPEALADELLRYFVHAMAPAGSDVEDLIRRLNAKSRKKPKARKMPVRELDNGASVQTFFDESIRKIFRDQVRSTNLANLHGTVITLQLVVRGKEDVACGMRIEDGNKMEILSGPMDKAMVTLEMSEDVYRHSLKGKLAVAMQTFINLNQLADRRRYDQISELKGSLIIELLLEDGSVLPFKLIFNGVQQPAALFKLTLDDYISIGRGELYGMSAFVSGRLEVEGDKPFAMLLSNLMR